MNHYQVRNGEIWFRVFGPVSAGKWRVLSERDVLMHLVLKTQVATWLYQRRGFVPGTLRRAA
ncbi:MAG TPA: hypothetical protein VFQ00_03780 [Terriglobales bacterium]|nr:hypothetical protein [Terriglobales bacterium]